MNKDDIIEIGKYILENHNTFVRDSEMEDIDNITENKIIIEGICNYLNSRNFVKKDITAIKKSLLQIAEQKFLENCADVATDEDQIDEESDRAYFSYIYKNGKYPR